ncbi:MAG: hypothetical protein ABGY42_16380 [bacterium]
MPLALDDAIAASLPLVQQIAPLLRVKSTRGTTEANPADALADEAGLDGLPEPQRVQKAKIGQHFEPVFPAPELIPQPDEGLLVHLRPGLPGPHRPIEVPALVDNALHLPFQARSLLDPWRERDARRASFLRRRD